MARKKLPLAPGSMDPGDAYGFQATCRAAGLSEPVTEYRFAAPARQWRFDYAFIAERVAVEVEGGAFSNGRHVRGAGFVGDMAKYNFAAVRGWAVLRYTPQQMRDGTALIQVSAALQMRLEGQRKC